MSTQYTNQAKTAVKYAEKTARRYKHSYIGTEHLLAGLLHEEEGTAGMVLRDMGISEERLMEMIRKLIAPEESNVLNADRAGYTPRATRMLEGAVEEADDLRSEKIGTEHLLLAMLREKKLPIQEITAMHDPEMKRLQARRRWISTAEI